MGLLVFQGRRGIASFVQWNLRPVIFCDVLKVEHQKAIGQQIRSPEICDRDRIAIRHQKSEARKRILCKRVL